MRNLLFAGLILVAGYAVIRKIIIYFWRRKKHV
jgi:hypothetical protein